MMLAAISRRTGGSFAPAVGMAAVLLASLLVAGCGLGPGKDTGEASLLVTRDYGSELLIDKPDLPVNESSNAMRILDENGDLDTRYGGEFVQSVNGLSGDQDGGRSYDWFFAVNGIVAERGYGAHGEGSDTGEGGVNWLMFWYRVKEPVVVEEQDTREGRLSWHEPGAIASLDIPETDRRVLWPLVFANPHTYFAVHIICDDGPMRWTLEAGNTPEPALLDR